MINIDYGTKERMSLIHVKPRSCLSNLFWTVLFAVSFSWGLMIISSPGFKG